jgi:hypothetical protein
VFADILGGRRLQSLCSQIDDDEEYSAQKKRDTLIRHTRQDAALAVLRSERIIMRVMALERTAWIHTGLIALLIILNAVIMYKVW